MKKKRKKIKKTVYSTAPLFVMVSICITITLFISIFILNVENFYSSDSKQVGDSDDSSSKVGSIFSKITFSCEKVLEKKKTTMSIK